MSLFPVLGYNTLDDTLLSVTAVEWSRRQTEVKLTGVNSWGKQISELAVTQAKRVLRDTCWLVFPIATWWTSRLLFGESITNQILCPAITAVTWSFKSSLWSRYLFRECGQGIIKAEKRWCFTAPIINQTWRSVLVGESWPEQTYSRVERESGRVPELIISTNLLWSYTSYLYIALDTREKLLW